MWLLTQNKAHNIFHSILRSDKCRLALHYYILYYNKTNSNKPYIVIVVCSLVTPNQWKQLNLLFIQLQWLFESALWPSDGDCRESPSFCCSVCHWCLFIQTWKGRGYIIDGTTFNLSTFLQMAYFWSEYQHLWDLVLRNRFEVNLFNFAPLENSALWHCIMLKIKVFLCLFACLFVA